MVIFCALMDSNIHAALHRNDVLAREHIISWWQKLLASNPKPDQATQRRFDLAFAFFTDLCEIYTHADADRYLVEPPGMRPALISAANKLATSGWKSWPRFIESARELQVLLSRHIGDLDRGHRGQSADINDDAQLFYSFYIEGVPKSKMLGERRTVLRRIDLPPKNLTILCESPLG